MVRPWTLGLPLLCLAPPAAGQEPPPAADSDTLRASLVELLNQERERLGLAALRLVPQVTAAALARSQGEALSDPVGGRRELFEAINVSRAAEGLHGLGTHPALDRAAQAQAEALLSGADRDSGVPRRERLVRRVLAAGYTGPDLGLDTVAETVVRDTLSAAATHDALLRGLIDRKSVLAKGYTGLGVGLAVAPTKTGYRTVWVLCLARLRGVAPAPSLARPRVNPDGTLDPP